MGKSPQDFNKRGSKGKIEEYIPEQNAQRLLQISSGIDGVDTTAIHVDKANEITAIDLKSTPVDDDELIIEDSEASYVKKSITIGGLFIWKPPIGFISMFSGTWVDNVTIPGWYKCDGNNGTVNLVNKFVRGAATSGGSGGSDDAVIVSHTHSIKAYPTPGSGFQHVNNNMYRDPTTWESNLIGGAGVSGTGKNIPAYYALIFIQRIS